MAASSTARYRNTNGSATTLMPRRDSHHRHVTLRSLVALLCSVTGASRLPQPLHTYLSGGG